MHYCSTVYTQESMNFMHYIVVKLYVKIFTP